MDQNKLDTLKQDISNKYNFRHLLASKKKEHVFNILLEYIKVLVKKKRFAEADFLKDWIIAIDPLALTAIIRSAEIIDDAKAAAINSDHLEVWQSLRQALTVEEYTALYYSMPHRRCEPNKVVVKQGTYFPSLFLINRGRLKLFTLAEGKNLHLKTVGAGEIIGADTFFDPSIWTMSVVSEGAEISICTHKNLQDLKKEYPALESKLLDYCSIFQQPDIVLRSVRKGRRIFLRNRIQGRTAIQVLSKAGTTNGNGVRGDLFDISKGGISCLIRSVKKEHAVKLFGRRIRTSLPTGNVSRTLSVDGTIVAVKGHRAAGNEYSLHVEFEKHLSDMEMQKVVYAART